MAKKIEDRRVRRLQVRIPLDVYERMQRAARLRSMTLTSYLIAAADDESRRDVETAGLLRLSREDQMRFVQVLVDPPKPSARLKLAAKRYTALIERRRTRTKRIREFSAGHGTSGEQYQRSPDTALL